MNNQTALAKPDILMNVKITQANCNLNFEGKSGVECGLTTPTPHVH